MKGVTMAPINPKEWDSINVTVDGKTVDLEEAFEVFEGVFDDVEDVFKNMEDVFGRIDKDINSKLNKLKMKISAKKPDKYEYVPDENETVDERWAQHMEFREHSAKRAKKAMRNLIVIGGGALLIMFAVVFFWAAVEMNKDSETGEPSKTPPAITEKLEKL